MKSHLSHRKRSLAALAAAGLTLAAAALTLAGAAPAPAATTTPACTASGLVIWLDTTGNGAAGSFYYDLEFTNLSGHACTLTGYPGVSGVDLTGHQLGSAGIRNPQHKPAVITLASATTTNTAGTMATVVLRITDVGNYPTSTCKPVTAAGLRVYAPGQTASTSIPFPFGACSRSGPTYLSVEAVQKGVIPQG
jgi:hypothetical protein